MEKYKFEINGNGGERRNNPFVEYYSEKKISPVRQDINNPALHYRKREKLYRMLGMPAILFQNQTILEVGPGSGYNTLAFFQWGAKVDLVEPNATGRQEMEQLFVEQGIEGSQYRMYPCLLEDFVPGKTYPIIIAEGFIPNISDQEEVLQKLIALVNENGIIVVTCMDEMGLFIEQLKRLIGHVLVRDVHDFDQKIHVLVDFFRPQLESLLGMSRKVEDWVKDQILNPAINNNLMSLADAIHFFGDDFDVLGSSQHIYTDYSWYKDIEYDYKRDYDKQYISKRHNFLMVGLQETILSEDDSVYLNEKIHEIRDLTILFESSYQKDLIDQIVVNLQLILPISLKIGGKIYSFVEEAIEIFSDIMQKEVKIVEYRNFFSAFGRSQQYLSMIKKRRY